MHLDYLQQFSCTVPKLCKELCFSTTIDFLAVQVSRANICFLTYMFPIELFVELQAKKKMIIGLLFSTILELLFLTELEKCFKKSSCMLYCKHFSPRRMWRQRFNITLLSQSISIIHVCIPSFVPVNSHSLTCHISWCSFCSIKLWHLLVSLWFPFSTNHLLLLDSVHY